MPNVRGAIGATGSNAPEDDDDLSDGFDPLAPVVDTEGEFEVVIQENETEPKPGAEGTTDDESGADLRPEEFGLEAEPEPEVQARTPDEEADEEDMASYSESVRKRIQREIRLRKSIQKRESEAIGEATTYRAAYEQAITESVKAQHALAETLVENMTLRQNDLTARMRQAREDGDTDKELKLQSELQGIGVMLAKVREKAADLPKLDTFKPPNLGRDNTPKVYPRATAWMNRNKRLMEDPVKSAAIQRIDAQIMNEGYDPDTEEYYTELNRRIRKTFANVGGRKPNAPAAPAGRTAPQNRATPPVAGARPAAAAKPQGNKVVLTRADIENMQRFRLDPNNKMHVQEYARQKRLTSGG